MCEHKIDYFKIAFVECESGSAGSDVWFRGKIELICRLCGFKQNKPFDYYAQIYKVEET